jgi:hypothetical protein
MDRREEKKFYHLIARAQYARLINGYFVMTNIHHGSTRGGCIIKHQVIIHAVFFL